jgi:hypothetical protein
MSKPDHSKRLIAIGLVILLILMVPVALLVLRTVWKQRLEARIQAKLAAIRQAGEPVTPQDVDRSYRRIPEAENSALLYLRADSNIVEVDVPDSDETNSPLLWMQTNKSPSAPIPPDTKAALKQWLGSNTTAIALIHQASLLKEGSYPLDLSRGFLDSGPAQVPYHRPFKLVSWEAILAADEDRPDAAVASLLDLFGIARSLEGHPYLIAQMIRDACLSQSAFTLENIINRTHLNEAQMRELANSFETARKIDWIKRSILGERSMQIEMYGMLPKPHVWYVLTKRGEDRVYSLWSAFLYPQRNMLDYLNFIDRYIATASLPLPQRLSTEIEIANDVQLHQHSFGKWFLPAPNWAEITSGYAEVQAKILAAETALAVERYRLANQGQMPGSIKDLIPAFLTAEPIGPTDGKPLQFKKNGNGYVISTTVLIVNYNGKTPQDVSFTVER